MKPKKSLNHQEAQASQKKVHPWINKLAVSSKPLKYQHTQPQLEKPNILSAFGQPY